MGTSVFDSILLKDFWSTEEMRKVFSDENRMQSWLDYEAALALVQADLGIIPKESAQEIADKSKFEHLDLDYIQAELVKTKHPLVPTLRALEKACNHDHGEFVHFGATTQDVIDTGLMLQLKQAHQIIKRDIKEIGVALYNLSKEHRDTPMIGRTLALQALPITFGHKTAIWLSEINRHLERLAQLEQRVFVGSVVGAVGTKASFGPLCDKLEAGVIRKLGLGIPDISWQPARDRLYEYGAVLGGVNATLNKIGNQILLLAHNEINELAETFDPGQMGSSTLPHKRNPAITENSVTVSTALKSNIMLLSDIMKHEHERDGAVWKMEWKVIPEICLMLSIVLDNIKFTLRGLKVNKDSMLKNLHTLGGYVLAERVMFALSEKLGKQAAHEIIHETSMQGIESEISFKDSLLRTGQVMAVLSEAELDQLLDPTSYVGYAPNEVDRALSAIEKAGWLFE